MGLTDAAMKESKPQANRYFVTDDRGLSLEIYPTGGMAWRYRYRLNCKLEKLALGKYPALSLKAARQKRDELATMVTQGQSPAKQKQLRKVARGRGDARPQRHQDHAPLFGQRALPNPGRQA